MHKAKSTKTKTSTLRKRDILDIEDLDIQLACILEAHGHANLDKEIRAEVLELFRNTLETGRKRLRKFHLDGAKGKFIVKGHSYLMDNILRRLHALIQIQDPQAKPPSSQVHHGKKPPLLHRFFDFIQAHRASHLWRRDSQDSFSLVATGGYGRSELAPFSDIDLLFLMPHADHPALNAQVEQMLYFLWDLNLDVGHAVRTIGECVEQANLDGEIATSMLESRFLTGNKTLFNNYQAALFERILLKDPESFLTLKLEEQMKRHERFGNSLFYLEPNIKENPGGLRDIHTFFWIAKYRFQVNRVKDLIPQGLITEAEYHTFLRCRDFLWRVRNALHYRAGRRDERLTFQQQVDIAEEFDYRDRMGVRGVELLMRRYYRVAKQVGNLSQIFLQKYKEEHDQKNRSSAPEPIEGVFQLVGDSIAITHPEAFDERPARIMKLFAVAQRLDKRIHPEIRRWVSQHLNLIDDTFRDDPEVCETFLNMLDGRREAARVLHQMNTAGVLGRFIPEFGRISGLTQHDMFHVYTVDEHSIRAVEGLEGIRRGDFAEELPLATDLISRVKRPIPLTVAVLLHDIAKGQGGQHEVKGEEMVRHICPRWGLNAQDTELVAWLVRHHLIMSRTAFRRDINDPQTVSQFARQVQDHQHLEHLLLLTVADIRAVGPGVWNQWKAVLLRELYYRSVEALNRGGVYTYRELKQLANARRLEALATMSQDHDTTEVNTYLNRFYDDYLLTYDSDSILEHFQAIEPLLSEPLGVAYSHNTVSDTTSMLVHTQDHPGLIARISGALASQSVNILSANANTTKDGMVLDIFIVQNLQGSAITTPAKLRKIRETLHSVLAREIEPEALLARSARNQRKQHTFDVPTSVIVDNDFSDNYTVLEITATDRIGLLFTITRLLEGQGIQIRTAKIATYGERAVDVFYAKDMFGLKLNDKKVAMVIEGLKDAIQNLSLQA
ncbi:MAG: [protein-PII] uridylyltransferase [Magnetococcales bacterium]|nr:[protein-PII] uridylyltransferase [Magnetococcales bacterium]